MRHALSLAAGAALAGQLPALPPAPLCWFALALGAGGWFAARRALPAALGAALCGGAWLALQAGWVLAPSLPSAAASRPLSCLLQVEGATAQLSGRWRFVARLARCEADGEVFELSGLRARLSWYRPPPRAAPADREWWRLSLRLKAPEGRLNPHAFDYAAWLFRQRLRATGYVVEAARARRLVAAPGPGLAGRRARALGQLQRSLPDDPLAAVLPALTFGERGAIGAALWERFRRAGTAHLLAISGLHIALVASMGALAGRTLWRLCAPRRLPRWSFTALGALALATVYAAMAGFALPTQRALLMLSFALIAHAGARHRRPLDTLGGAAAALLLIDPLAALGPSFWLSVCSVAAILIGLGARPHWGRWRQLAWVNTAPGLVLAPLSWWLFSDVAWVSPAANALAVPLFSLWVVPCSLLAALLALWWPAAAEAVSAAALWGLALCDHWQRWLLSLPAPEPALGALAGLGLALLAALALAPPTWRGRLALLPLALLLIAEPRRERLAAGDFRLTALDVGHGLAVLVETREHVLVFDAGPGGRGFDAGAAAVIPALRGSGWAAPDRIVISHGDADHRGGLAALRRRWPAAPLQLGCRAGQHWRWDAVAFTALHPARRWRADNDGSCVIRVQGRGGAALLVADTEALAEAAMLARGAPLGADLLLVPHHGSASSSTAAWLDAVAPALALVSVSSPNRYRLPHPSVRERYRARGIDWLNTAHEGALRVTVGADGIAMIERWRVRARRWWHPPAPAGER